MGRSLQPLDELLLVLVQVLHERFEALYLLYKVGGLLSRFIQFSLRNYHVLLILLNLILLGAQLLHQVEDLDLLLIFLVFLLNITGLAVMNFVAQ